MGIVEQMLAKYEKHSKEDIYNALREIFQEITLLGLYNGGFFEKATFYGGTCLRIFYDLQRFSEDLDFSLLQKDEKFNIETYFPYIINEFEALGIQVSSLRKKPKKDENNSVELAFLAIDPNQFQNIKDNKVIKIKIEADKNPPLHFQVETKTLLMPKSFNIKTMTLPNLYASKIHALLFRTWNQRVKGRDWFDFEWYVKHNIPLNLEHLCHRIKHFGNLPKEYITQENLKELLLAKIDEIDLQLAVNDIRAFAKNYEAFENWNKDYFKFLVSKMRSQQNQILPQVDSLDSTPKPHKDFAGFEYESTSALNAIKSEELGKQQAHTQTLSEGVEQVGETATTQSDDTSPKFPKR